MPPSKTSPSLRPSRHSEAASFGYALKGIGTLLRTQPHARFHAIATALLIGLCIWLQPSRTQVAILALAAGLVWLAEAVNTCLEFLVDLVHPEWGELAGMVKDVAAGGVLLAAIAAAVCGLSILGPLLISLPK